MSVASNLCLSEHEWFITNFVGRSSDTYILYILTECIFKHGINYSKPQHTHTTGTTNAISFATSRSKPLLPHLHHHFQLSLMNAYVRKPLLSMRTTLLTSTSYSTHLQQPGCKVASECSLVQFLRRAGSDSRTCLSFPPWVEKGHKMPFRQSHRSQEI